MEEAEQDEEAKKAQESEQEKLKSLFAAATGNDGLDVKLQALTDEETPALLTQDEQGRRFSDMSKIYGQDFRCPNGTR
jgi:molecular chaperone HtpG